MLLFQCLHITSLDKTILFSMCEINCTSNIFLIKDSKFNLLLWTFKIITYKLNPHEYKNLYIESIIL